MSFHLGLLAYSDDYFATYWLASHCLSIRIHLLEASLVNAHRLVRRFPSPLTFLCERQFMKKCLHDSRFSFVGIRCVLCFFRRLARNRAPTSTSYSKRLGKDLFHWKAHTVLRKLAKSNSDPHPRDHFKTKLPQYVEEVQFEWQWASCWLFWRSCLF